MRLTILPAIKLYLMKTNLLVDTTGDTKYPKGLNNSTTNGIANEEVEVFYREFKIRD